MNVLAYLYKKYAAQLGCANGDRLIENSQFSVTPLTYRKDIQILRGIAVLLVVLFHLEIAGFENGFLGVDIFFVISGYLMAALYSPVAKVDFFIKRARRLLPAYFVVVILTIIAAAAITTPNDYEQVSAQALFATVFASNIGFWMENSYFDKAAFKPLLHLWSLGVEIQFYLLIPVLFWAFQKVKLSCYVILIISATICFLVLGISPKTSFFWLPFRLWEFLLGFSVAQHLGKGELRGNETIKWVGVASLVAIVCILIVKIDGMQFGFVEGHPGLIALLISLATTATLYFRIPRVVEQSLLGGLLEKIGNYSYSIYLTHYPMIVLFLYKPFSGTLLKTADVGETASLASLVALSSVLLFMLIEKPFRANRNSLRGLLFIVPVVIAVSYMGAIFQKTLIPVNEMLVYKAWADRDNYRCGKIKRFSNPMAITCEITDSLKSPSHRVLLVGNSHADSIKRTFSSVAYDRNVAVYFMVENTPLMKDGITPQRLIDEALEKRVDAIILHFSPLTVDNHVIDELVANAKKYKLQLLFIMPVPAWDKHVPRALISNIKSQEVLPSQNIDDYKRFNEKLLEKLASIDYAKFRTYQVADAFCQPDCRLISTSGKPLYFDRWHLTLTGSEVLRSVFESLIVELD